MEATTLTKSIPSDEEIAALEQKLAEMKKNRELAKNEMLKIIKNDDWIDALGKSDVVSLMKKLQAKLRGAHRGVRGSPVPEDLKEQLIQLLKEDKNTLDELRKITGLSISYISRVKADLKKAGLLTKKASA